ncbi:MAG: hypothetical protein LQ342_001608 [Letrouitia transgressa]|nr:MAG: hypothetical protein LQ342_001608 [Letrouitia transgressa]
MTSNEGTATWHTTSSMLPEHANLANEALVKGDDCGHSLEARLQNLEPPSLSKDDPSRLTFPNMSIPKQTEGDSKIESPESDLVDRTRDFRFSAEADQPSPTRQDVQQTWKDIRMPEEQPLQHRSEREYLDPTPMTPRYSTSPSRTPSNAGSFKEDSADGKEVDDGSTAEIQSIMDQFGDEDGSHRAEDMASSRLEIGSPAIPSPVQHPPRKSSLEPLRSSPPTSAAANYHDPSELQETSTPQSPVQKPPLRSFSIPQSTRLSMAENAAASSPRSSMSSVKPQPPMPDPEPDLPFDFHRFLEQLRHRTADPVAKFLRSFLIEFGKKQWMVHEQVKIISDFLAFITNKMAQCDIWRGVSDAEFDNAKEGMEKLVMNRLYSQTFSPAIPPPVPLPGGKGKRKNAEKSYGPGRKGQHQEDIERDEILAQKVRIYGWVQEEHLDIPPVGDSGRRFLSLAQQELLKIKTYRAPRDKIICVLNCCKVIFGFLRNSKMADTSADSFVPLLIYVVLHANPEHLVSNLHYILRFRNQDKLGGEAGYYLSSLMGAIQFIETLDRTTLTISDKEFERNVEASVSAIAERHQQEQSIPSSTRPSHISEKSGLSEPEIIPRNSFEAEYSSPRRPLPARATLDRSTGSDGTDDSTAVGGLLRTIQKPLSSLGKIFSEDPPTLQGSGSRNQPGLPPGLPPGLTPQHQPPPRLSPSVFQPPRNSSEEPRSRPDANSYQPSRMTENAAAHQASAEAAEAQRIQRAEHQDVVEYVCANFIVGQADKISGRTLAGMFPDLDRDIIDDVVREKQGR